MENVQEKKGLGTLAWIGIGCGALTLIIIVIVLIGGLFVAGKVKEVASDFEKNPELAAARLFVKLNPEIEEVKSDEDTGTITIREKETGKEITASFEDIKDGKFTFTDEDGKKVTFGVDSDDDGGSLTISSEGEEITIASGKNSGEIPEWVPIADGLKVGNKSNVTTDNFFSGSFTATSDQAMNKIKKYYQGTLSKNGYSVNLQTFSDDTSENSVITGTQESTSRTITVFIEADNNVTTVNITYTQGE
ncbi:hypothetical protein K8T06_04650 [bacterium]|nr:hypothetical protein [bacterium]